MTRRCNSAQLLPSILHHWLLRPVGIPARSHFSWDDQTAASIRKRNPFLLGKLLLPPRGRPFPILGASLLGPSRLALLRAVV